MHEHAAELQTAIASNAQHLEKLTADEAERLINAHTILPPEGQPLPSDPGAPDSIQDLKRIADGSKKAESAQGSQDNGLITPEMQPVHSLATPVVVERVVPLVENVVPINVAVVPEQVVPIHVQVV